MICPARNNGSEQQQQLVAKKVRHSGHCSSPLKFPDLDPTGFADDKNFYVIGKNKVLIFEKDAIGDKINKPVPYTVVDTKDFFAKGEPGGGNGTNGGGDSRTNKKGSNITKVQVFVSLTQ